METPGPASRHPNQGHDVRIVKLLHLGDLTHHDYTLYVIRSEQTWRGGASIIIAILYNTVHELTEQ